MRSLDVSGVSVLYTSVGNPGPCKLLAMSAPSCHGGPRCKGCQASAAVMRPTSDGWFRCWLQAC